MIQKNKLVSSGNIEKLVLPLLVVLGILGLGNFLRSRSLDRRQRPNAAPILIGVLNVQSGPSSALGKKLLALVEF